MLRRIKQHTQSAYYASTLLIRFVITMLIYFVFLYRLQCASGQPAKYTPSAHHFCIKLQIKNNFKWINKGLCYFEKAHFFSQPKIKLLIIRTVRCLISAQCCSNYSKTSQTTHWPDSRRTLQQIYPQQMILFHLCSSYNWKQAKKIENQIKIPMNYAKACDKQGASRRHCAYK